ncbi:MAG TPA: hypothetical protein PKV65_18900 [Acidovorax defluvii]|nr:hypothetical protein [Acidovorax defluvii]
MNKTYAAKRLLEHGPLTLNELVNITSWSRKQCCQTMHQLSHQGIVGSSRRGRYDLAENIEKESRDDMLRLRSRAGDGGFVAPVQSGLFDVWRAPVVVDSEGEHRPAEQAGAHADATGPLDHLQPQRERLACDGWLRRAATAGARIEAQAFAEGVAA